MSLSMSPPPAPSSEESLIPVLVYYSRDFTTQFVLTCPELTDRVCSPTQRMPKRGYETVFKGRKKVITFLN